MLTGTVWGITLIGLGIVVTFAAAQVLLAVVFARRVEAARGVLRARPWISALVGVLGAVALAVAIGVAKAAFAAAPQIAALLGMGASLLAMTGLSVVAAELGSRLPSTGAAAGRWRAVLRGSVVATLASFLPFVGWIVIFPAFLVTGLGAWLLSFVTARPEADDAVAEGWTHGSVAAPPPVPSEEPAEVGA